MKLGFCLGVDGFSHCFRLGEVNPAVHKCAKRELTWLRESGSRRKASLDQCAHGYCRPVKREFHRLLSGIASILGEGKCQPFISVHVLPKQGTVRFDVAFWPALKYV